MNTISGLVRDLLGNYHLGATLTDDDILHAAEGILEHKLMRSGETLGDPAASARYLKARLAGYPYEVFACLFLDNRHRVIAFEELFRGSIDGCSVHPREVIRSCIKHNAAAVIFAHNHPSGVSEPSAADRAITQRLKEALDYIDVRVLDHLVVGAGEPTSLALRGWV
jgi:DNA repair protein RadC